MIGDVDREPVVLPRRPGWTAVIACLALFWAITWLYAPALRFGLIWDDPEWFGRVVGRSLAELLQPSPDFQFYRPGTMLYNRLFVGADGLLAVYALHWLQLGWHLLNVAAVLAISRLMGFSFWAAYVAALLVGVYPFSHQAVSWAAPQQPLVFALQNGAWLFYLWGRKRGGRGLDGWLVVSLLLFGLALTVQEVTAPYALLPLVFEVMLRGKTAVFPTILASFRHPIQNGWLRPLAYPLLTLLFLVFWGLAPREAGITRLGLDGEVAAYLGQGVIYPVIWLLRQYGDGALFWLATAVFGTLLLWGVSFWRGRGRLATTGLAWAFLGLTPALFGLPFSYVQYAPRLLYYAAPGVAWLWVCALWPKPGVSRTEVAAWIGMLAALGFIALDSARQLADFQRLYAVGTDHLQALVAEIGESNGRYLFLNFPDRYAPKEPPYPLGYWGVTLAPVVVELDEFPAMLVGGAVRAESYAMPWLDLEARENGPFMVDMRGVIVQPEELYELASDAAGIYLTHYGEDGRFRLQRAGSLYPTAAGLCGLAYFGADICLHAVHVSQQEDDGRWRLRLFWSTAAPLEPHLTIFAHLGQVGQPPLDQQDGDVWRGALPMRYWQPGDLIDDQRTIADPGQPGEFSLQIGVYNWLTGERLTATDTTGHLLPDNAYSRLLFPDEE